MLSRLLRFLGIYKIYEKWLYSQIDPKNIPLHIAVILDGNRRWAVLRDLPTIFGHQRGAKTGEKFLEWCIDLGIKTVTVYVFSTENFQRPDHEVSAVFKVIERQLKKLQRDERIHKKRVRVKAIGKLEYLPKRLRNLLLKVEESTRAYNNFFFNIAIAYGGRTEIVDAARKIAREIIDGKLSIKDIDETRFSEYLYTSHLPNPNPDLVIRTSGEERLSGFLLWQSAYSELLFLDVFWPDFRKIDVLRAIRTYQHRKRRFGA